MVKKLAPKQAGIELQMTEQGVRVVGELPPPLSDRRSELLRTLFSEVASKEHWKNPIDAVVPRDMVSLYSEAIVYMTATVPEEHPAPEWDKVRLVAVGYLMGPAGP